MQNQSNTSFSSQPAPLLLQQCPPNSYDFSIEINVRTQGDRFEMNDQGRVVGAYYASGAIVKILDKCMIVRAEDYSLWFADSQRHFHPLD